MILVAFLKMHLTPNQRSQVVTIYFGLERRRSDNRAKVTSLLAAQLSIFISEIGFKKNNR